MCSIDYYDKFSVYCEVKIPSNKVLIALCVVSLAFLIFFLHFHSSF